MTSRLQALLIAVSLGGALTSCATATVAPVALGTCIAYSRSADGLQTSWTAVPCDGPHTHVLTAWLPGVHEIGFGPGSSNPCPSGSDMPELEGDGVFCFTPAASPSE